MHAFSRKLIKITLSNSTSITSAYFLLSGYSTPAAMVIGKTGHCLMLYNGFRFGPIANQPFVWRCTSNRNRKRCTAKLRSKIINGVEMIKNTVCIHNHERPPAPDI